MYEELVKRLREATGWKNAAEHYLLMNEAADAIEAMREMVAAAYNELANVIQSYEESMPRWIPVTERLPEEQINPNTRDFEYVLCVTIWGDVRPFKYGTPIGQKDAHFWNGAGYVDAYITHWMQLPTPPKYVIDGATAVSVPLHGRLIDADALKKNAYPFPCAIGTEWAVTLRQINDAPTIIPASGGAE